MYLFYQTKMTLFNAQVLSNNPYPQKLNIKKIYSLMNRLQQKVIKRHKYLIQSQATLII